MVGDAERLAALFVAAAAHDQTVVVKVCRVGSGRGVTLERLNGVVQSAYAEFRRRISARE